jgi:hypothetical protein
MAASFVEWWTTRKVRKRPVFDAATSYARGDDGDLCKTEAGGNQVVYMVSESPAIGNKKEEFRKCKARRRRERGGFE